MEKVDSADLPVDFLLLLERLKHVPRAGWKTRGIDRPESVSGHIFLMTVMAALVQSGGDSGRRRDMALVHDMAESLVGDITPFQGVSREEKHHRELLAMRYLQIEARKLNPAYGDQIMELWLEFEEGKTKDAQIVRDLDRMECALELITIEQKARGKWRDDEMFEDQINKVTTEECQRWKDTLVQTREAFWKNRDSYSQIVFLIGPPGAGKTTQGSRLAQEFGIRHISAGDILRREVARSGSEYAELISDHMKSKPPQPVPPRLVVDLLEREIEAVSEPGQTKCLLIDGFPRDEGQAVEFEERICPCVNTILLDCDDNILIKRLQQRGASSNRSDDNPEAIKSRVEAFNQQNMPVEKHLRNGSPFFEINYNGTEDEVYEKLRSCFEQIRGMT